MAVFDILSSCVLFLTHTPAIVFFILVFCFWDFKKALISVNLLLLTLILNPYLKSIWQVPLPVHLGDGWAFPSGHMQVACAFYGWMAWKTPVLWFRLLIFCLLGGVGWSLIHGGFHTLTDVLGGVFFAVLTIGIYTQLLTFSWVKDHLSWMGFLMTLVTFPLILFYPQRPTFFMLFAQGSLILLSVILVLGERFFPKKT